MEQAKYGLEFDSKTRRIINERAGTIVDKFINTALKSTHLNFVIDEKLIGKACNKFNKIFIINEKGVRHEVKSETKEEKQVEQKFEADASLKKSMDNLKNIQDKSKHIDSSDRFEVKNIDTVEQTQNRIKNALDNYKSKKKNSNDYVLELELKEKYKDNGREV